MVKVKKQTNPNSLANLRPVKPGEVRNPRGRTPKHDCLTELIKDELEKKHINGVPNKQMIAQALVLMAVQGNIKAIEMVHDFVEGKPRQAVEMTGKNGEPLIKPSISVVNLEAKQLTEQVIRGEGTE